MISQGEMLASLDLGIEAFFYTMGRVCSIKYVFVSERTAAREKGR